MIPECAWCVLSMLNLVIISDAGAGQGSGRRMERPREHWAIFWVEKRSPVFSSDLLLNHPVAFQKAAAGRSWWVSLSSFHPVCLWVSQILQIPVACRYTTFTVPCTEKRSETGRACGRLLVRVLQRFIFHCLIKNIFENIFALCKNLTLPSWLEITPRSSQHIPQKSFCDYVRMSKVLL